MMESVNHLKIRQPAVADQFYPGDASRLAEMLQQMLDAAKPVDKPRIKAMIVPHAGYVYSGPVAASAYQALRQQADQIRRVVLLGPTHRVGFYGIATSTADQYLMPLGPVTVDRASIQLISALAQVQELDQAHQLEHSLEVQLPFLQTVLTDFSLVPLVVGECSAQKVAEVLELLWGGDETLIVISSDLSHYHPYAEALKLDQKTSYAILNLSPDDIHYQDACGRNPLSGLLLAAKKHELKPEIIDLRNSGDTAGSRERVVGYGAYLFTS